MALLFGVLITRLFNLQIAGYDDNLSSAESKKTKTITSQGSRGTIMDVNSLTLAYDKQIYNVQFYRDPNYTPTDIDETTGRRSAIQGRFIRTRSSTSSISSRKTAAR